MQIPIAQGQFIHDLSLAFATDKLHEAEKSSKPPKNDLERCEILWSYYFWGVSTFEEMSKRNEDT